MPQFIRRTLRRMVGLPPGGKPNGRTAARSLEGPLTFAPRPPADIVVSYSRHDRAIAEPLVAYLRAQGFNVWWDRELYSGEDLHDAIVAALDAAKAVVVIWSDAAVASMWVRDEARRAARKNKLITAHVPSFDLDKIPLGFGERRCDNVEDRDQIVRALAWFGVLPQAQQAEAALGT
ncbi:MAG: toll/interleukin-1 receptor domain-containing protein [Hyphomicrobiaceae bacterium]|nr:MAG: toll/interleukin-1 receptor domain-containing protein [Hyphomicrobiaceae bacterium]